MPRTRATQNATSPPPVTRWSPVPPARSDSWLAEFFYHHPGVAITWHGDYLRPPGPGDFDCQNRQEDSCLTIEPDDRIPDEAFTEIKWMVIGGCQGCGLEGGVGTTESSVSRLQNAKAKDAFERCRTIPESTTAIWMLLALKSGSLRVGRGTDRGLGWLDFRCRFSTG